MFYKAAVKILVTIDTVEASSMSDRMNEWVKSVQKVLGQLSAVEDIYRRA